MQNHIVEFLDKTQQVAEQLQSEGRTELAKQMISTSLILSATLAKLEKYIKGPTLVCHCGRMARTEDEVIALNKLGECIFCDTQRSDL